MTRIKVHIRDTPKLILYVRKDGSDNNDGLSNTPNGAFLTVQKALEAQGPAFRLIQCEAKIGGMK